MVAVAVEHYLDGPKSDPRFVKWVASYQISTAESYEAVHYPMHRCTDEDLSKFYPPDNRSAEKVQALSEANELFCLGKKAQELILFGGWRSGINYRALDIQLVPCSTRYVDYDGKVSEDDGSCVWGHDKAIEYLGPAITIMMVTNQGIFQPKKFNDDRVTLQSMLHSQLAGTENAQWSGSFIRKQELQDEIDIFQLGQNHEESFE